MALPRRCCACAAALLLLSGRAAAQFGVVAGPIALPDNPGDERGDNIAHEDGDRLGGSLSSVDTEVAEDEAVERIENGLTITGLVLFWYAAAFIFALPLGIVVSAYVKVVDYRRIDPRHQLPTSCSSGHAAANLRSESTRRRLDLESYRANVVRGSKMLVGVAVIGAVLTLVKLFCSSSCYLNSSWVWIVTFISYAFVGYASFLCVRYPLDVLFWPVICYWFAMMAAISLPPFQWSCTDLAGRCWESAMQEDLSAYLLRTVHHGDCTLAGPTSIATLVTWILLLPWVIPRSTMFYVVWVWLLVVLPMWVVAWREITEEDIFPNSKMGGRFFILVFALLISHYKSFYFEGQQFHNNCALMVEKDSVGGMFEILHHMVPLHVIPRMMADPNATIAQSIERVTILFVLIANFQKKVDTLTPQQLLNYLNSVFNQMDQICKTHDVTKIETVGEEYVCCVGVQPSEEAEFRRNGHGRIAENMIRAVSEIMALQRDELQFQMGMHTGPIVAGIVGKKLPRYRLVGDTINTAARMMQKAPVGRLQFGEETRRVLPSNLIGVESRGEIEMKGKGLVKTFLYSGHPLPPRASLMQGEDDFLWETLGDDSVVGETPRTFARRSSRPTLPTTMDEVPDFIKDVLRRLELGPRWVRQRAYTDAVQSGMADAAREIELSLPGDNSDAVAKMSSSHSIITATPVEEAFQKVQTQLAATSTYHSKSWWRRIVASGHGDFSPEMEEAWAQRHHRESCQRLGSKVGLLAMAAVFLTLDEVRFFLSNQLYKSTHALFGKERMAVFLYARLTTILMLMLLWWGVEFEIVKANRHFSKVIAFITGLTTVLMFISYDALLAPGFMDKDIMGCNPVNVSIDAWLYDVHQDHCESIYASMRHNYLAEERAHYARFLGFPGGHRPPETRHIDAEVRSVLGTSINTDDNIFPLRFIIVYYFIVKQSDVLFMNSLLFVAMAIVMLFCENVHRCGQHFYTLQCRILFVLNSLINSMVAHTDEENSRGQFKSSRVQDETSRKVEDILDTLLPTKVVQEMSVGSQYGASNTPTHLYRHATIAQSDLCGFTKLAATKQPKQVVGLIGELFKFFDALCDKYFIYKVETVGDAYIAGVAESTIIKEPRHNSPVNVILFSLGMVKEVQRWSKKNGFSVNCRVGVHYGECIGGVVGSTNMAYHLFGSLMNGIELLESTSIEGEVQVSRACKFEVERYLAEIERQLPLGDFVGFRERTDPHLQTSKGEVHSYEEIGGRTLFVQRAGRSELDKPVMDKKGQGAPQASRETSAEFGGSRPPSSNLSTQELTPSSEVLPLPDKPPATALLPDQIMRKSLVRRSMGMTGVQLAQHLQQSLDEPGAPAGLAGPGRVSAGAGPGRRPPLLRAESGLALGARGLETVEERGVAGELELGALHQSAAHHGERQLGSFPLPIGTIAENGGAR